MLTPSCTGALWDTIRWSGGLRLERGWCNNETITGPAGSWVVNKWNNGCIWWREDDPEGPVTLELTLVGTPGVTQAAWAEYGWDNYGTREFQSSVAYVTIGPGASTTLDVFARPTEITADGTSGTSIAAVLKDASCALVPDQPVVFSTSKGTLRDGAIQGSTVTVTTNSQGYAFCDLIADTTPGIATVTASAMGATDTVYVGMWEVPQPPEPTAEGSNLGGNKDVPYALEPVHTGLGNFVWSRQLFAFPGKGPALSFEVSYNSRDGAYDGPLGFGWTHSYNVKLTADGTDVSIKWGDGHTESFQGDISGHFLPVDCNTTVALAKPDSDHYLATLHSGVTCLFDASGRLLEIADLNGNRITLTHSTSLDRITDTAGRQINFSYGESRVAAISSPLKAGDTASFQYDGDGNLVAVTDPRGKLWRFTYDGAHRVLTHVDARGNTALSNTYDPVTGRITAQADALGRTTTFSYVVNANGTTTTITPPSGNAVSHAYDVGYNITKVVDGGNNQATFTRGDNGSLIKAADKRGATGKVVYDASQNPVMVRDRTGAVSQTSFNTLNRPTAVADALGGTTSFGWNASGNLTSIANANGDHMSLVPNAAGQPVSLTDFRGKPWSFAYDPLGLLQTATDPLGGQYALAYDAAGRVTQATLPIPTITTRMTYDDGGNVLTRTDPLGHVTTFAYDDNGNLTSATFVPTSATTSFTYDAANRLTKVTDPLDHETTYTYDVDGNLKTATDPDGVTVTYEYDKANRVTAVLDALGHRVRFTFDPNGNMSTVQDELANTWTYSYDNKDRPIMVQDPLGAKVTRTYDALGRVTSQSNQLNWTTRLAYDAVGNVTNTVFPDGGTLGSAHDAMGNVTSSTDALGHSWQAAYDDNNRLVSRTDPAGHSESYAYDGVGRLTQTTKRDGRAVGYAYDLGGRLTAVTLPGPSTISFGYDAAGNVTTMTDSTGTTAMTYDTAGRRLTRTDPYGKTVAYAYTPGGRLAAMTYPGSKAVSYAYDAAGRLTTVTDWLSNQTTYAYDAADRVTRVTLPNGTHQDFTCDAAGRTLTMTHAKSDATVLASYAYTYKATGQIASGQRIEPAAPMAAAAQRAFGYDPVNRILNATTDGVATSYAFAADGNLETRTVGGVTTTYAFDALDRLTSVSDGTNVTTYRYDGFGNRLAKTHDGTETRYLREGGTVYGTFDGSGAAQLDNVYGGTLLYSLDAGGNIRVYHGDERGSVVAITDGSQNVLQAYAYDPYGRVVGSSGSLANEFGFVGLHGVLTDENGLCHMQARSYDPDARRFVSEDPLGLAAGPNLYAYTDGDPVNSVDPTGNAAAGLLGGPPLIAGADVKFDWKKQGPFTDNLPQPKNPGRLGFVPSLIVSGLIVANVATAGEAGDFLDLANGALKTLKTTEKATAPIFPHPELSNLYGNGQNMRQGLNFKGPDPMSGYYPNGVFDRLKEQTDFAQYGSIERAKYGNVNAVQTGGLADEVETAVEDLTKRVGNSNKTLVPNLGKGLRTSATNAANRMGQNLMTDPKSRMWLVLGLAFMTNQVLDLPGTTNQIVEAVGTAKDYWANAL